MWKYFIYIFVYIIYIQLRIHTHIYIYTVIVILAPPNVILYNDPLGNKGNHEVAHSADKKTALSEQIATVCICHGRRIYNMYIIYILNILYVYILNMGVGVRAYVRARLSV